MPNGANPQAIPPEAAKPIIPMGVSQGTPVHINWWTEMSRFSKGAVMLTAVMVFWSTIGENMTACIDRSVNEKKTVESVSALQASDEAIRVEQVMVKQKIANFESNFAIQTMEIGEVRQDVSEMRDDLKEVQRDIKEMLVLMAERNNP